MMRHVCFRQVVSGFALGLAVLVLSSTSAVGQVTRPFHIVGEGVGPQGLPLPGQPARPHWAIGYASYLGEYYGEGGVQVDSATPNTTTGHITGQFGSSVPFVFMNDRGDKLSCYYGRTAHGARQPGTFDLAPVAGMPAGWYTASFVAEFVPYAPGCTGTFKGVKGSWIMYAYSLPFQIGSSAPLYYSWEGEANLTFPKR